MTRLYLGIIVLVAIGLCPAAAPPRPAASRATAPLELILLGEAKLARVQVRVEVDGKTVPEVWEVTFARLFAFFDRNGDGVLDPKEAARLPTPRALRQAMGNGFTPPTGPAPAFADLDRNGDGKVTPDELASFYRSAGLGNVLIGVGRLPGSAELTDALLQHLDTDGDGKVSEKEWKAAADALKKLDRNDDELIGAGELVPKIAYPGAAGTTLLSPPTADASLPDVLAKLPLILLPTDKKDTHWAAEVVRRRDPKASDKRTAAELMAWRKQKPDAEWVIRFGNKAAGGDRFVLNRGRLRVEGWVTEGKMMDAVESARRQLVAQFGGAADPGDGNPPQRGNLSWLTPIADRDGNGKLDRKELDAWLDLQEQIARGQVFLTILDGGTGLFELLDTNHDGALSVRELRGAWDRVKEAGCLTKRAIDRAKLPRVLVAAASRGYPRTFGVERRRGPAWFRAMDRNGDGDVSRREFTGPPEVFNKLDTDKNGLISAEEAAKAGK